MMLGGRTVSKTAGREAEYRAEHGPAAAADDDDEISDEVDDDDSDDGSSLAESSSLGESSIDEEEDTTITGDVDTASLTSSEAALKKDEKKVDSDEEEDDEPPGMVAQFHAWRKKRGALRRDPTLKWFEKEFRKARDAELADDAAQRKKIIKARRSRLRKDVENERARGFIARVRQKDEERFQKTWDSRSKQLISTQQHMALGEEWRIDDEARRVRDAEAARKLIMKRNAAEDAARKAARDKGVELAHEKKRQADLAETQATIRIMRQAGVVAAANAKEVKRRRRSRESARGAIAHGPPRRWCTVRPPGCARAQRRWSDGARLGDREVSSNAEP